MRYLGSGYLRPEGKAAKWEGKAPSPKPAREKDAELVLDLEDDDVDADEFIEDTEDED